MDVAKDLDWSLELEQRLLIFELFLSFLKQVVNYFLWQVHKRNVLWVFFLVVNYFIVEVIDDDIHYELLLIGHVGLGNLK